MKRTAMAILGLVLALILGLTAQAAADGPQGVDWLSYDQAVAKQKIDPKPIMISFQLPNCGFCRKMNRLTYSDETVQKRLNQDFLPVVVNLEEDGRLGESFRVEYVPTHVFISPEGEEVLREDEMIGTKRFLKMLDYVAGKAYRETSFDSFAGGK